MKKIIFASSIILMILLLNSTSSFSQTNKKSEKARKNVKKAESDLKDAKQDLRQARLDSTEDYIEFKKEAQEKIASNDQEIQILSEKKWENNNEYQRKYNDEILKLRNRNKELRNKIDASQDTSPSRWSAFKKEFSHDMNKLGEAIKNTMVNSKK